MNRDCVDSLVIDNIVIIFILGTVRVQVVTLKRKYFPLTQARYSAFYPWHPPPGVESRQDLRKPCLFSMQHNNIGKLGRGKFEA